METEVILTNLQGHFKHFHDYRRDLYCDSTHPEG